MTYIQYAEQRIQILPHLGGAVTSNLPIPHITAENRFLSNTNCIECHCTYLIF